MARFSAQEALRQKRSAHLSPQSATHDCESSYTR